MQTHPEAAQAAVGHADTSRGSSGCCRTNTSRDKTGFCGTVWDRQFREQITEMGLQKTEFYPLIRARFGSFRLVLVYPKYRNSLFDIKAKQLKQHFCSDSAETSFDCSHRKNCSTDTLDWSLIHDTGAMTAELFQSSLYKVYNLRSSM
jgi:hypothetical protein